MPTYQYFCENCGNIFEQFSSISNFSRERECPICGNSAQLKISGGNGLIFKGNGFYITDYVRNQKEKSKKETTQKGK